MSIHEAFCRTCEDESGPQGNEVLVDHWINKHFEKAQHPEFVRTEQTIVTAPMARLMQQRYTGRQYTQGENLVARSQQWINKERN